MKFELFTWPHYLILITPIAASYILFIVMRGKKFAKQHLVGKTMAIALILFLVVRNIYNGYNGAPVSDLVPLQLCHLSAWVIVPGAILTRNKYLSLIAITLSLPAGYISLVFLHYDNLLEFQAILYILLHAFIVIGALYLVLIYRPKFNFADFAKSFIMLVVFFLITIVLNNLFINTGVPSYYFYSVIPEPGTPLETFYEWGTNYRVLGLTVNPIYNGLVILFGTAIMFLFYKIYSLIPQNNRKVERFVDTSYWRK